MDQGRGCVPKDGGLLAQCLRFALSMVQQHLGIGESSFKSAATFTRWHEQAGWHWQPRGLCPVANPWRGGDNIGTRSAACQGQTRPSGARNVFDSTRRGARIPRPCASSRLERAEAGPSVPLRLRPCDLLRISRRDWLSISTGSPRCHSRSMTRFAHAFALALTGPEGVPSGAGAISTIGGSSGTTPCGTLSCAVLRDRQPIAVPSLVGI